MNCILCLKNNPNALTHCSQSTLEKLDEDKVINRFQAGEYLFREGSEAKGLYCLQQGKILIEKTRNQKAHPLRFIKKGYLLGMPAVFGNQKHIHSAKAIAETDACFIPRVSAFKLLETDPGFNKYVLLTLMKEMEELETRLARICEQTAEQRVAELLLDMQETYGLEEGGALPLTVSFNFLSGITNLSDRTLQKVLDMFISKAWFKLQYGRAFILNKAALKMLATGRLA